MANAGCILRKAIRMMRTVSRRCCWLFSFLLVFTLLSLCSPLRVHADGGAPNLAYVSGTPSGVSVIDVLQGKVTRLISVAGDPNTILLSLDGRFLYVTQPGLGQVSVILAETGRPVCTARLPGEPAFLAIDQYSNILYAAGSGAARVTALDPTACAVRHVFQVESPVYGLAVSVVATGSSVNHQLWVAGIDALTIFDGLTEQQLGNIPIPNGPQYLSLPPGATVYVTTRQGIVDAVDIRTRAVKQLLTGGRFGPMDYNELTGEVYVPDEKHNLLAVLTPVFAGSPLPKEPNRVIHTDAPPQSVAITNDGLLGFIALRGGKVVMLDLLRRQIAHTDDVGGTPHFVITGLYPPSTHITPPKAPAQQASAQRVIMNNIPVIVVCVLAIVFLILVFILLLQRLPIQKGGRQGRRTSRQ
jgi:DNA-binding beta-propeller fold protein YncE